jgi:hypothetical protein
MALIKSILYGLSMFFRILDSALDAHVANRYEAAFGETYYDQDYIDESIAADVAAGR